MWHYNGKLFDTTPEEFQGFVYELTEIRSNKKYIGKKNFWKPKTLPITKTRKRRVRTRVESDWKEYYGSSNEVRNLVEKNGQDQFKREILNFARQKEKCLITKQSYSLIITFYSETTTLIILLAVGYTQNI